MACHMLHSPGSRLSLDCTLLLLKTPLLELMQVASRKSTGLGAATVVTCLTLKCRSLKKHAKREVTGTSAVDGPPS